MNPFWIYKKSMTLGTPFLKTLLALRVRQGKEDPDRLSERMGIASMPRPNGSLLWMHVASVGEAQSVLSLIELLLAQNRQLNILITSVTKTSAELLAKKLPERAFHQYAPLDNPDWVRKFLDHWQPNIALWIESELWPVMLNFLRKRRIPSALLNAHMSPSSYKNWKRAPEMAQELLSVFLVILAQSKQDAGFYSEFCPHSVVTTENIKYAAKPLPCDPSDYAELKSAIGDRPVWLYASTHDGEEELAGTVHKILSRLYPDLLTIVALRHPDRREIVLETYMEAKLNVVLRGDNKTLPSAQNQVYIVDTMGELGLLYKLAPMAMIGRSFSKDGGGGHNPIEAALLNCAVLHGPNVQNSQELYDEMDTAGACLKIETAEDLAPVLKQLFGNFEMLSSLQQTGQKFASDKANVLQIVMDELEPVFLEAHLPPPKAIPLKETA